MVSRVHANVLAARITGSFMWMYSLPASQGLCLQLPAGMTTSLKQQQTNLNLAGSGRVLQLPVLNLPPTTHAQTLLDLGSSASASGLLSRLKIQQQLQLLSTALHVKPSLMLTLAASLAASSRAATFCLFFCTFLSLKNSSRSSSSSSP